MTQTYQEQEPVAWAVYCDGFIALPAFDDEQDALREMQRRNKKWPQNKREVKALYDTTPPRRTWVGLFDEEIEVLFQTAAGADEEVHIRFARAIESKMKELNT